MYSKALTVLSIATAALGVAACGSKKSSSSSSSSSASSSASSAPTKSKKSTRAAAVPSRTYRLKLTGKAEVPKGAPNGTGAAVVTLRGKSSQVCWRFSRLHGFTSATFAHIHRAPAGKAGNIVVPLSTGPKLHHAGCVKASPTITKAIARSPKAFYVNIHSKTYPGGAVRSQL
jgi:CHRD domain